MSPTQSYKSSPSQQLSAPESNLERKLVLGRAHSPVQRAQRVDHCCLPVASPPRIKYFHLSTPAGTATSKNPTIISCEVWSPQVTSFSGSGLWGLFFELSYHATARNLVPAFNSRGSASL